MRLPRVMTVSHHLCIPEGTEPSTEATGDAVSRRGGYLVPCSLTLQASSQVKISVITDPLTL